MLGGSALAEGRRLAESRMTSRALVRRPTGTTEGPDGYDVPGYDDVYNGIPFRLAGRGASTSRTVTVGESEVQVATSVAHFPHTTELVDGDLFEVVAGEHPGRFFRVVDGTPRDQTTALRVEVVEVQRPDGWV